MRLRRLFGDLLRMTFLSEPYYRYKQRQKRKRIKLSKRNPLTLDKLVKQLSSTGLTAGDTVMVHSGLSALGYVEGGADTVVDAFLEVLGPKGTLLMPTYPVADWSIENIRNLPVLEANTPSCMGAITNKLLGRQEAVRSLHPTHSWAGIGPKAEYFLKDHLYSVTPCGPKSPFEHMLKTDGLVVTLGSPWGNCTFWHIIEDRTDFPLQVYYPEVFNAPVRLPDGEIRRVPFKIHSHELQPLRIDLRPDHSEAILKRFREFGIVGEHSVGLGKTITVRAKDFLRGLELLLEEGITIYAGKP